MLLPTYRIRPATRDDASDVVGIYAPLVRDTAISFATSAPTPVEIADEITRLNEHYAWLVAESDGKVVGYAYGHEHRQRAAYRWSVETSVYVEEAVRGQGVGLALYEALFPSLISRGFSNAYAGITMPNDASVALHTKAGFSKHRYLPQSRKKVRTLARRFLVVQTFT